MRVISTTDILAAEEEADVHRPFVVDGSRLAGVISTTDIVRAVANGQI